MHAFSIYGSSRKKERPESQPPPRYSQTNMVEYRGRVSNNQTNNKSLYDFKVWPHEAPPLLTNDDTNAIFYDHSQTTPYTHISSNTLTPPAMLNSVNLHEFYHKDFDAFLNKNVHTDVLSNAKNKDQQRSPTENIETQPSKMPKHCYFTAASRINYFKGHVDTQRNLNINNTSSHYVDIQPEETHFLTTDETGAVFFDKEQEYRNTRRFPIGSPSKTFTCPSSTPVAKSTQRTTISPTSSQANTYALLNSAECIDEPSNPQSEETKALSVVQQLPIADAIVHPLPLPSCHVKCTLINMVIECLKNGAEMSFPEIRTAIKKRYPYIHRMSNTWDHSVQNLLRIDRTHPIFEWRKNSPHTRTKHWRLNKMTMIKMRNMVIRNNEQFKYENGKAPSIDKHPKASCHNVKFTYRNAIITFIQNKGRLTYPEICNEFSKAYPLVCGSNRHWKNRISGVLAIYNIFIRERYADGAAKHGGYVSLCEIQKKKMGTIVINNASKYNTPSCTVTQPNMPPPVISRGYELIASAPLIANDSVRLTESDRFSDVRQSDSADAEQISDGSRQANDPVCSPRRQSQSLNDFHHSHFFRFPQ